MVNDGIIDENGELIQIVIDWGFVDGDSELDYELVMLVEFKVMYLCYKEYDDSYFSYIDQGWVIDSYVMKLLLFKVLYDLNSSEEQCLFVCYVLEEIEWFS